MSNDKNSSQQLPEDLSRYRQNTQQNSATEPINSESTPAVDNIVAFPIVDENRDDQLDTVNFIHLRVHSEYSLTDSTLTVKKLINRSAEENMPAIALTDFSNLFAFIKFYQAARAKGIKPIVGVDILLNNGHSRNWLLTLLAKNDIGYQNIIELVSLAYTQGQKMGTAVVDEQWLIEYSTGLIVLSGAQQGDIGFHIEQEADGRARERIRFYRSLWGNDFFIELQRLGKEGENFYINRAVELAIDTDTPIVATNDVRFDRPEDFEAHEARVCIAHSEILTDIRREQRYKNTQFLCSAAYMQELFKDLPQALENTVEIAKRCNVIRHLGKSALPKYINDPNKTEGQLLEELSVESLDNRLAQLYDVNQPDFFEIKQRYLERLQWELEIINKMDFPGYFLIVMDFIRWSKNNGIPVGPGRGSGAGSLVAYALDITNLDPLKYDLLFERFLNPERISMPDFDIDFCVEGRDRVINYVSEKYGNQAVSQIVTFGSLAAKAVVRDVARVMGKPYSLADGIAKLIPFTPGISLEEALKEVPELPLLLNSNDEAQEIWQLAKQLEGLARNCGKHAGGVLIAPHRLTDYTPLYADDSGSICSQFDKDDVEIAGLVKFDFLGLRNLTIIKDCLEIVNAQKQDFEQIDIETIPLDDSAVYDVLSSGENNSIFQLESMGMCALSQKVKPSTFEDIIALVALYRPGPLESGMVDDFVARKHKNKPVSYPDPNYQHDDLKPILEPTYGIIVYQEQVMKIAQVMGGYSLGKADFLRKAMGKKLPAVLAEHRSTFVEGAKNNGYDADMADKIFSLIEKFGGYGFNKSHSAAYALIAYQTAWLKHYYTAAYMVSVMSSSLDKSGSLVPLIAECRRLKLDVKQPNINQSFYRFVVDERDPTIIYYGLGAIKGTGYAVIEAIVRERDLNGAYTDIFDFCNRNKSIPISAKLLETLAYAGALDCLIQSASKPNNAHLNFDRVVLIESINDAVKIAEQNRSNNDSGMIDLFGDISVDQSNRQDVYSLYRSKEPLSDTQRLFYERDKLDLFLTGHPINQYLAELQDYTSMGLGELRESASLQWIGGWVVSVHKKQTRKGKPMAIVTIDDQSCQVEFRLFAERLEKYEDHLKVDSVILVQCQLLPEFRIDTQKQDDETQENQNLNDREATLRVVCKKIKSLESQREESLKAIRIHIYEERQTDVEYLMNLLKDYSNQNYANDKVPVCYQYHKLSGSSMRLNANINVQATQELFEKITNHCGAGALELLRKATVVGR